MVEEYKYPIALTQMFRFCGNPFRIDLYRGCNFGCNYCFATTRAGKFASDWANSDFTEVEKLFSKAFDNDKESREVNIELLRKKVPLHLGGMSDPFQPREFKYGLTYKFLELTNKYNYPVMLSTKVAKLPEKYFEVLNPKLHAFQISLIGLDDDFVKQFDKGAPTASERISFIRLLKSKGFWVSIRIQPVINMGQILKLVEAISSEIDYITVEHFKYVHHKDKEIQDQLDKALKDSSYIKQTYENKLDDILRIKAISKCPVGVGDNDLHEYSDSRNCCGMDTINENFNNWLKYNYTYFVTGEYDKESIWTPESSVRYIFNSGTRGGREYTTFKDYVHRYIKEFKYNILKEKF